MFALNTHAYIKIYKFKHIHMYQTREKNIIIVACSAYKVFYAGRYTNKSCDSKWKKKKENKKPEALKSFFHT